MSSTYLQIGNTPTNSIYLWGPRKEKSVTVTVASARAGMLAVGDEGTYTNGVKPYANAAAKAGNEVVLDIKTRPNLWVGKLNYWATLYEQYEVVPSLWLIPGLAFYAYIVVDTTITKGTTLLSADTTNLGSLDVWTPAKDGTYVQLYAPLLTKTANDNDLLPVMYVGESMDGEA